MNNLIKLIMLFFYVSYIILKIPNNNHKIYLFFGMILYQVLTESILNIYYNRPIYIKEYIRSGIYYSLISVMAYNYNAECDRMVIVFSVIISIVIGYFIDELLKQPNPKKSDLILSLS